MFGKTSSCYLIVSESELICAGIKAVLIKAGVGRLLESKNIADAVTQVRNQMAIDLVIFDAKSSNQVSTDFARSWSLNFPGLPVLAIAQNFDPEAIACGRDMGIRGFVPLSAGSDVLLGAIDLVLAGGIYLPEEMLDHILRSRRQPGRVVGGSVELAREQEYLGSLTPRQQEVLTLVSKGYSNKEICRDLGLSVGTVKNHVATILRQLEVKNRTQAVSVSRRYDGPLREMHERRGGSPAFASAMRSL